MHVGLELGLAEDALRGASTDRWGMEEFDELKLELPSWTIFASL